MKKILYLTFILINFHALASDNEADKIVRKYLKAIGGKEQWEQINTIRIIRHEEERHSTIDNTHQVAIKREVGFRVSGVVNNVVSDLGYFNNQAWRVLNPPPLDFMRSKSDTTDILEKSNNQHLKKLFSESGGQIQNLNAEEMKVYQWQTQLPWCFIDYEKKGYQLSYKGDAKIGEAIAVSQIEITSPSGAVLQCFFDKKTGLLRTIISENREYEYSNYQTVAAVKMPYSVSEKYLKQKLHNGTSWTKFYDIDQIQFNVPLENSLFEKPKQ
jgi:hypothetical protein